MNIYFSMFFMFIFFPYKLLFRWFFLWHGLGICHQELSPTSQHIAVPLRTAGAGTEECHTTPGATFGEPGIRWKDDKDDDKHEIVIDDDDDDDFVQGKDTFFFLIIPEGFIPIGNKLLVKRYSVKRH